MRLLVSDLGGLMASPAALLLDAGMPAPGVGLALWRASPLGPDWLLHPEGAPAQGGVKLAAAPAGVLGVLAAATPVWLAAWPDDPPPVLGDVAALATLLAGRVQALRARNGALRESLVTLRAEHEEGRVAMTRLMQATGQGWPGAPRLVHADTPGPAPALPAGRTRLRRLLPAEIGGVCGIGLHLSRAECGPGSALRLRLLAHESERVLGAWVVPGEALVAGWLALDLPVPAPPWREGAAVEIDIDLMTGDLLALPEGPALRLFRAEGPPRFTRPAHWEGASHGLALPPAGVRLGLPPHVWAGVPRRLTLRPGEHREVVMPALPVLGLDRLLARLRLHGGSAMQAALHCPGSASGWRDFDWQGEVEIALPLPAALPATTALSLSLRQLGSQPCMVEWQGLVGVRAGETAGHR